MSKQRLGGTRGYRAKDVFLAGPDAIRSVDGVCEDEALDIGGEDIELSIVLPCLDEAETLGRCVRTAQASLAELGVTGEVVVADNGSTDGSPGIARALGAVVVHVAVRGYGAAVQAGVAAARGEYVIMADADGSYDLGNLGPFVEQLRAGKDLVMGNRFRGGIRPGAMPPLNRYLGNPVLSFIGRLFFRTGVRDFHCGIRGFRRSLASELSLSALGMEFASEMVVKAALGGASIAEVPTTLSPDGRSRSPHLRRWRDGWRHLRLLLMYAPGWLYLVPGVLLVLAGGGAMAASFVMGRGGVHAGIPLCIFGAFALVGGYQAVLFSYLARVASPDLGGGSEARRGPPQKGTWRTEHGLLAGCFLMGIALLASAMTLVRWASVPASVGGMFDVVVALVACASVFLLGIETVVASFFVGILGLRDVSGRPFDAHERTGSPFSFDRTEMKVTVGE